MDVPCDWLGVNIAQGRNAFVFRRWRQTNERSTVFSISSLVTSPSSHLPRQIIITLNANNAADSEPAQAQPRPQMRWRMEAARKWSNIRWPGSYRQMELMRETVSNALDRYLLCFLYSHWNHIALILIKRGSDKLQEQISMHISVKRCVAIVNVGMSNPPSFTVSGQDGK